METKKLAVGFILMLLSTVVSFLGFMKALDHGTTAQIAASAGGFVIFISLLITVILHNRKQVFRARSRG